jgi:hypothetical protein
VSDEPSLEELMAGAAAGRVPEARFLAALHAADVVLPRPPGQNGLVAGEPVDLPVVTIRGREAVPVFTSPEQLGRLVPGAPHVLIAMRSLQAMLPAELALVVNPHAELSRLLAPEEVAALPGAPPGRVGAPAEEQPAVLDAVAAWAAATPGVAAAYRAAVAEPSGERLTIGLDPTPGTTAEALLDAAGTLAPPADAPFALLVIDRTAPGPIERFMLERTEPFWRREG